MKKSAMCSLTITALSLIGSNAFAQDNVDKAEKGEEKVALDSSNTSGSTLISQEQIDAIKKELAKKDPTENKVVAVGVIQVNANTSDSQRSNTPDFSASKVRLGVNVVGGIATGQLEVQFNGNQPPYLKSASAGSTEPNKDQGNGQVTIRRAQLNLDVLTLKGGENTYTTTVSLGGIRVGGADGSAPDTAWTTSGFGRTDGIYLKEAAVFGKAATAEIGVGVFNNINSFSVGKSTEQFPGWGDATAVNKQANWMGNSFSKSQGFIVHAKGAYNFTDDQSLAAAVYYGTQGNAPTTQDASKNVTKAKDVGHLEASLVYNHKGIFGDKGVISTNGVSFWYENEDIGRTKIATANSGDYNYSNDTSNDSQNISLYGFGVAGDTAHYLTNMIQKGDRLTYGASYAMANVTFGSSAYSSDYNVSQIAASVGYAVNTFETAFNVEYDNSDKSVFNDSNGNLNKKDATKTYLTAAYAF